jgi:hypothetical protein
LPRGCEGSGCKPVQPRIPGEEDRQSDGVKSKKTAHYASEAFRTSCAGLISCGKEELNEKVDSIIER